MKKHCGLLSLILMVVMVLSLVPFVAGAEEIDYTKQETFDPTRDVTWVDVTHQDLEVFVTDGYNPIENAEVTFEGETKATGTDGKVLFVDVLARDELYDIITFVNGYGEKTTQVYVDYKIPEGTEAKIDFIVSYWKPNNLIKAVSASLRMSSDTPDTWIYGADMPIGVSWFGSQLYDGKIYVIGGVNGVALKYLQIYDIASDTWVLGTSMMIEVSYQIAKQTKIHNGKIYVFGGDTLGGWSTNKVQIYDIVHNTWSLGSPMPIGSFAGTSILYNDKIYIAGGESDRYSINKLQIYDVKNNTWSLGSDMPQKSQNYQGHLYNDKIYIAGGCVNSGNWKTIDSMQIYDIKNDTWTTAPVMPRSASDATSQLHNGKIYIIGGAYNEYDVLNTVQIYDIANNNWTLGANMSESLQFTTSQFHNGKIYVIGGCDRNRNIYSNNLKIYNILSNEWTSGSTMPLGIYLAESQFYNGKIYTFGGAYNSNKLQIYTMPDNNNISTMPLCINNPVFMSGISGNTIINTLQSGFVRSKFDIANDFNTSISAMIMVKLHKKGEVDTLLDVVIVEREVKANSIESITAGFNVPSDASNYEIRIEVWDSPDEMNKLADDVIFQ